jgi:hypothetical protein
MNLSLSFESEDGSSVYIVLAKPALQELGAAIVPGLLAVVPVLERISHLLTLKREATAEDEAEAKAAEQNENAATGRLWHVIGYDEGRWRRLTEIPLLSWERAEELLSDRTFRPNLSRIVTLDEWQVFFDPSTAPPGVSAALADIADERIVWVLAEWTGLRWRPRKVSFDLDSVLNEEVHVITEAPNSLLAVCSFTNWQCAFRERNEPFADGGRTWQLNMSKAIQWDGRRQLWAVHDGLPKADNDKCRSVTGEMWLMVYHCGFANPPRSAAGKTERPEQPSEPEPAPTQPEPGQ